MISKDLERIIELSSRDVTDEEGLEHFNLKNKLEESLEKAKKWDSKIQFWIDNGVPKEKAEKWHTQTEESFIRVSAETYHENIKLKEKLEKITELIKQSDGSRDCVVRLFDEIEKELSEDEK